MNIELFINKSLEENANVYFDQSKKLKKKIPGTLKAIEQTKKEIAEFEEKHKQKEINQKKEEVFKDVKQQWFHQFRHTTLPSGLLAIWSQNAQLNELLIKKYTDSTDLVFHTEQPGSPFGIIKQTKDKKATELDIQTMALCIGAFSSSWARGLGTTDVFYVRPEQVSKEAQSGEFIAKGSFMIRGEKTFLKNVILELGITIQDIKHFDEEEELNYTHREIKLGIPKELQKVCKHKILILTPTQNESKDLHKNITKHLGVDKKTQLPKFVPTPSKLSGVLQSKL